MKPARPQADSPAPLDPDRTGTIPVIATPPARTTPSFTTTVVAITLVGMLVFGLDAWRTWTARDTDIAAAKVETANLARSLAQHTHDMLVTADALLVSLRDSIEAEADTQALRHQLTRSLASQITTVQTLRDIMVFDAEGFRIVNSGRPAPAVENITDRAYFQFHAANPGRGPYIGPPVQGKLDGTWILTLSRRINGPDGAFAGVAAATFSINAIRQFYEAFDVGKQGFISLNTTQGVIITRHPAAPSMIGRKIAPGIVYSAQLSTQPLGNWLSISPIDGVDHLGAYRTVADYPLVVVVGRGVDELLAPWRTNALIHLAISLGSVAITTLLGLRFASQLRLRHAVQEDLHRSERQYRLLADNNTDLIVQLDAQMRHVYASPASKTLFGRDPQALLGAHPRDFVRPDDWPALDNFLAAVRRDGTATPIEYRPARPDNVDNWIEVSGQRLASGDGMILVKRDVTHRRSTQVQLRQAQRMEAVGQLTAGVAHDFNNLLQAQLGAIELLLSEIQDQPKAIHYANVALGAAEHAAKLTHSLLSFSRQQLLDPVAVAIPTLLSRLQTILSRTLGPRIGLEIEIEVGLASVFADPAQLEAALLNLAINARDAMPEGGCLFIEAAQVHPGADIPDHLDPTKHLMIAVTDNGVGMSPATLAQACEPFFTTKEVGKGSGLGLSMVQGFARQSGGTLRFQSTLGHGTRIELWLPVASSQGIAPPAPLPAKAAGMGRILLVDDGKELLMIMTELLEIAGFDVVPVTSGEAALAMLANHGHFDALVTDFAMPGIDGGELAIRAQAIIPSLPTIIITGYAESDKLLTIPPKVSILRKPISGDELTRRICEITAPLTNAPDRQISFAMS